MFLSRIGIEKPSARGPSPSRKAHLALKERLNRKLKPPPLPVFANQPSHKATPDREATPKAFASSRAGKPAQKNSHASRKTGR
jgi:hypothetical protein